MYIMFNFILTMLSVSSIILPENNTMIFPGNNYDIKWTNMNSSDYLNIQMFVGVNNRWKTNIENHHLFSVTTDTNNKDNLGSYNLFIPYYFLFSHFLIGLANKPIIM